MKITKFILIISTLFSISSFASDNCKTLWSKTKTNRDFLNKYKSTMFECEDSLKEELHYLTKQNHKAFTYPEARIWLFHRLDNINGSVCSVYSPSECKNYSEKARHPFKLNIEHTIPQSKGAKEYPAKSDLHHLYVTSKATNSKRANLDFCVVEEVFWSHGGSKMGFDENIEDCFEPHDDQKGNVARAYFYFSVRYNIPIVDTMEKYLRQWHKADPVNARDIKRNKQILELQGNSNPFIDFPKFVKFISNF